MSTGAIVGIAIACFIAGGLIGFFLARYMLKKELKKHPPVSEKAIRAMFKAMGRPASEKQIKQVMASMQQADK
jgi:uncharacterized protein